MHLSMRSVCNILGTMKTWSDTQNLWCHWWEGLSDLCMVEDPGRRERLLSMETRGHEDKAMSYA